MIRSSESENKGSQADKKNIPVLQPASVWAGKGITYSVSPLDIDELKCVLKPDIGISNTTIDDRLTTYLPYLEAAFSTFGFDTVQSRAWLLAHWAGEDGGIGAYQLVEKDGQKKTYKPFYGRGTLHVTLEYQYIRALAFMGKRREQLCGELAEVQAQIAMNALKIWPQGDMAALSQIALLNQKAMSIAVNDILPLESALWNIANSVDSGKEKENGFLLAAAYAHSTGCIRNSARFDAVVDFDPKTGAGAKCMSGNQTSDSGNVRKNIKNNVYVRAFTLLSAKQVWEKMNGSKFTLVCPP